MDAAPPLHTSYHVALRLVEVSLIIVCSSDVRPVDHHVILKQYVRTHIRWHSTNGYCFGHKEPKRNLS